MRLVFITLLSVLISSSFVYAQSAEKCDGLDMNDPVAIKACLESDEVWYAARTKPMFEPNKDCAFLQMTVVKHEITSTDPNAGKRVNSKTLDDESIERPTCETISDVVELIHDRPSSWSPCMGYDEASDKFEHFKYCIVKSQQLRYNQPNRKVGKMDCKRAVATYQKALGDIYPVRQDQGDYYGRKLPATYTDPDCAQVDAFFNAAHQMEMAEMEKRHQEQMALRAKKKAEEKAAAKEFALKQQKAREMQAKYEESYQDSLDAMNETAMENFKTQEHPKDSIDNKNIRHALIQEVWSMMPEKRYKVDINVAKIIHTTAGYKFWTNNKMAPNVYHALKSVDVKKCNVNRGKAHCLYDVTVSSSIDYHGMQNPNQRAVYNNLGGFAGAGPRTFSLESDFTHNGTQWKANLTYDQAKKLMPPEAKMDPDQASKEREKAHCDYMSTLTGWPVC